MYALSDPFENFGWKMYRSQSPGLSIRSNAGSLLPSFTAGGL